MGLEQLGLETGLNKAQRAIDLLQAWEPPEGYYFADSGGKDSKVTEKILILAKVKYDAHHCVSPIDPPQLREFLKQNSPNTQWDYYARGFWKMVDQKGLPMRTIRWCCEVIKEAGGEGRVIVVGNRRSEGNIQRNQHFVETPEDRAKSGRHKKSTKTFIRPILDFDNYEIWQYIRENNIPYCSLYDEGAERKGYGEGIFKRLGCVLCPFSRNIAREEEYFPKITANWLRACGRLVEATKARGYLNKRGRPVKHRFETAQEMYDWWVRRY